MKKMETNMSGGGENIFNKRLCFGEIMRGECWLPSCLSPSFLSLAALAQCKACVLVCASLPARLLFAAATDEQGRGGKADVSGQRKTGGVWIDKRD